MDMSTQRRRNPAKHNRQESPRGRRWLWAVEELEHRVLLTPTAYLVDSTSSSVLGSGNSGSLPYIIGLANADSNPSGSQIEFDSSVFSTPQTIALTGPLILSESAGLEVIDASGVGPVTISGAGGLGGPAFQVAAGSTATLKALTIANGSASAIDNAGVLTLSVVDFVHNIASRGGAIANSGELTVSDCSFDRNSASKSGGGIYESGGTVKIAGSTFVNNKSASGGAVFVASGTLTLSGDTLTSNTATLRGGGIDDKAGSVKVSGDCQLSGNVAGTNSSSGSGGGIYETGGLITITGSTPAHSTLAHNTAVYGGGVFVAGGTMSIAGSDLTDNKADQGGAVFQNGGSVKVSDGCAVTGNTAQYGGAFVDGGGELSISRVSVSDNSAASFGGGIYVSLGSLTIRNSSLAGNRAAAGGGLFNYYGDVQILAGCSVRSDSARDGGGAIDEAGGTLNLSASTVSGNTAQSGGGILIATGSVTIGSSTLSGNVASENGGGIDLTSGTLKIANATLADNTAAVRGGGIFTSGGALTVANVTIAYNGVDDDGSGGGLEIDGGSATIDNSIVALNVEGTNGNASDIAGTVSGSYNLIGPGGSGGLGNGTSGNLVGVTDPGLSALGEYGGLNQTIGLLPGSPAIGSGSDALSFATDQRGIGRPNGLVTDIGAFESRGFTIRVSAGKGQSTPIGTALSLPLEVAVTNAYNEPVAGGVVTFTAPGSGASASLSSDVAIIGADGTTSVTATANGTVGEYNVTASVVGAASPVSFALSNDYMPAFSGLADNEITYGTGSLPVTGIIADGSQIPVGDEVSVTVNGATQFAIIGDDGSFSATLSTVALDVASSPYSVSYEFLPQGFFLGANASSELMITAATLVIKADSMSKSYGQAVTFAGTEFTETGLFSGDTITGVTLASEGASAIAAVGGSPYSITPSEAMGTGLGNYTISYVSGTLAVQPSALTITADSTSKTYGQTVTFAGTEFTETGLVNGDTLSGITLTSTGAVATAAVSGSPFSLVPSAAVGTGLGNYTIGYVSGSLAVRPAALTITADSTSKTYGQTVEFVGTEFTESGLVSGDTLSGITLTSTGAVATAAVSGSPYSIVPSAAVGTGLGNYTISYVSGSLAVQPTALTITADSTSKTYGQTAAFAGTEFTATGLVNGDTVSGVTLMSDGASMTATVGGSPYSIVPGAALGNGLSNYTISYVNGSLTVQPAALTITADSTSKTYGRTVTFAGTEFTETGLVNGDTITGVNLTSNGAAATAAVSGSSYSIVPSAATGTGLGNYTISYVSGSLTVQPAALTIKADSTSKSYGQTVEFVGMEFTATGLVNGDTVSGVTLMSDGASVTATVGDSPYTIVPSAALGSGLSNYTISYINATLMVRPAALMITADSTSKTYGQTVAFAGTEFGETGLINGDAITGMTLTSTGTTATAPVGGSPYSIVPSAAAGTGLGNYTITYESGNLTVQPAALTISAGSMSKTYGQTIAFSGNDFTESGLVNGDTITGVTLTSTAAGATAIVGGSPYAIVPSAALGIGLSNYTISYVSGSLSVQPAALTITADDVSKTYGQTVVFAGNDFTETGLVNGDTISSVAETSGGTVATAAVAGSPYAIVPSLALGSGLSNYAISYVDGVLAVRSAALTITADGATKTYGQDATFSGTEFSETGLVNGDTITGVTLTSNGALATATVAGSPYSIVPSVAVGTGLGNYTVSYLSGSLTVQPATLTITADNVSKTYGQTATFGSMAFTENGLVNGDTITGVTFMSRGAGASATVAATPYLIVPANAVGTGLANYAVGFRAGTLMVNPAPLTIVADSKTMSFGGAVPALTATYIGFVNGDTAVNLTTPVKLSTTVTSDSRAGTYAIVAGEASSPDYTITFLGGVVTVDPYVPPAQSRYRSAAAFVTTLYEKLEAGSPEPVPFLYWMGRYMAHESPLNVTRGFAKAIDVGSSGDGRPVPKASLRAICSEAQAAARRAAR